jgi:hypothetical protein
MNRDWMFGVAMALAVALYPNLIEAALYPCHLQDAGAKCWLIFFSTAGPALVAPVVFGIRTTRTGDLAKRRRPKSVLNAQYQTILMDIDRAAAVLRWEDGAASGLKLDARGAAW